MGKGIERPRGDLAVLVLQRRRTECWANHSVVRGKLESGRYFCARTQEHRPFLRQDKLKPMLHGLFALALAEGFVEEDGGGRGGVEGFDVALHGDLDAGVGGVDDVFGEAGAFVPD